MRPGRAPLTIDVGETVAGPCGDNEALFARRGIQPLRWLYAKVQTGREKRAQTRPLRFVQIERESFWGPTGSGNEEGTQVAGTWHVTNVSHRKVVLLRARIKGHEAHLIDTTTAGVRDDRDYHQLTPIAPRHMGKVSTHFIFFPPIISGNRPLVAEVVFTDNYEDEHRVRSTFRCVRVQP